MAVDLGDIDEDKFGRITRSATLCYTLKLEGVPRGVTKEEIEEIEEALEMYQVEVEQIRLLEEEGIILVTLKASEDGRYPLNN